MCLNVCIQHVFGALQSSLLCFRVDLHVVRGGETALMLDERRIPPSLCIIM